MFSRLGLLDVPQVRAPRPRGPAGAPSIVRRVRHGPGSKAPRRRRCRSIAEERQRWKRGHAAATLRADGGRGRSPRCSSSMMLGHRLPPRALTSAHEPHRRTALVAPAGPPGRKPNCARHLAALATKPGEICGLVSVQKLWRGPARFSMFNERFFCQIKENKPDREGRANMKAGRVGSAEMVGTRRWEKMVGLKR